MGKDIPLRGNRKILTMDSLGWYWLPPYVRQFKLHYPDIVLDITIGTRYTNLSKREADIVIPAVNKQPDYMVGRKLAPLGVNRQAKAIFEKDTTPVYQVNGTTTAKSPAPCLRCFWLPLICIVRKTEQQWKNPDNEINSY